MVLTVAGILLTMNQVFFWNLGGLAVLTNSFLYLLVACFVPVVFIVTPLRKPAKPSDRTEQAERADRTERADPAPGGPAGAAACPGTTSP